MVIAGARPAALPPPELRQVRMRLYYRGGAFELEWTGSELRLASDPANLADVAVRHSGKGPLRPGAAMTIVPRAVST